MIQAKAVQSLADAHRQDLMASARPRRTARHDSVRTSGMPHSSRGLRMSSDPAGRRAVAPRLGAWLIDFGTRLGGTTVRTS